MHLRPDSLFQEFLFSEQELLLVKTLSPLQIAWLQTKFTKIFKEKATKIVPEDSVADRSYLLTLGSLEGKLELLQELFDEHKEAISRNKELKATQGVSAGTLEAENLSTRASNLVDNSL